MARTKVYQNVEVRKSFVKSCGSGWYGDSVEYIVPAGKYSSIHSQSEADGFAMSELNSKGQSYANSRGKCYPSIWYNDELITIFYKDDCEFGINGHKVEYTVPSGKYVSYVSKDDANKRAENESEENGQIYANSTGGCCEAYISIFQTDVFFKNDCPNGTEDPNGTSYGVAPGTYISYLSQKDADIEARKVLDKEGQETANSIGTCATVYYSEKMKGDFYRSKCPYGYKGMRESYFLPAGVSKSFISQAEANEKARVILEKEGKEYARIHGRCEHIYCQVNVVYNPIAGGEVSSSENVSFGDVYELDITPNDGYAVKSVFVDGENMGELTYLPITVRNDVNIKVYFKALYKYDVTISASPVSGGMVIGGGPFFLGDKCALVAKENPGYLFSGWYKDNVLVSPNKVFSFIVNSNTQGEYVSVFKNI